MSEDAPAEPIFANDIDERFPLPEKEEGELSDDDEERLEAGTSQTGILTSNSESEIDRTIAEVKKALAEQAPNDDSTPIVIESPKFPAQNSCKNMLDPEHNENLALGAMSSESVTESSYDFRSKLLDLMNVKTAQSQKVHSPAPPNEERSMTPGRMGILGLGDGLASPRRPSDYAQRQRPSRDSPPRPSSRGPYQPYDVRASQQRASDGKRKNKERWTTEEKRLRNRPRKSRSPLRTSEKRKDRRERDRRSFPLLVSPEPSVIRMQPVLLKDMMPPPTAAEMLQNIEKSKKTPPAGQQMTSNEYRNMVLGTQQPPAEAVFHSRDALPQSRDNHDIVAMDVSTTPEFPERSCTPFGPAPSASMTGHRSSLETDESALRTLLIEQLKKKRVATPDEEKGMADEQKYLKNKTEMIHLETSMRQRLEKMRQLTATRRSLLEQVEAVMKEMTSCQEEFWKEKDRKDVLRPLLEDYESEQMLAFGLDDSLPLYYSRLEQETSQLKDITLSAHRNRLKTPTRAVEPKTPSRAAIAIQTSPPPPSKTVVEQAAISSTSVDQEMDISPTDKNEIYLREVLLKKQASKTTPAVTSSSPEKIVPQQPVTPQNKGHYSPHSPEAPSSPINFAVEEENEPSELWTRIKSNTFPMRLLAHAGVQLPQTLEAGREICSYEIMGKCKNVDCQNRHLKDNMLDLREVVSMILWGVPQLSGRAKENHSSQVDHVLKKQDSDEDRFAFIRRLLRPLLTDSGLLEHGLQDFMVV